MKASFWHRTRRRPSFWLCFARLFSVKLSSGHHARIRFHYTMKPFAFLLLAMLQTGCSTSQNSISRRPTYDVDYGDSPQTTAEMGRLDARRHIAQGALRIIRYDMPPVRTGYWDSYYRPFEDLKIQEVNSAFESLAYCESYNDTMDKELLRRYGRRYEAVRSKILPPAGAKHFMQENAKFSNSPASQ
jgi:hypothetical protein